MEGKLKNILMFVLIGAFMIAGYFFFFRKSPDQAPLVAEPGSAVLPTATTDTTVSQATQDFLPVLLNVKSIKLDNSIFLNPAFLSLRDSSIVLVQDGTEGRPNPFAPIGSENIIITQPSATSATTSNPAATTTTPKKTSPTTN